jgi:hypothetical protein
LEHLQPPVLSEIQELVFIQRLLSGAGTVTARQLKEHDFARRLATLLHKYVGYEGSLQSRVLLAEG